jgi:hydroxyacylglutathione hydrolase
MIRETMAVGLLQCNCTVLGDETTREAIVIDPGDGADLARLQDVLARHALTLKAIVITHAHIDHIGGAAKLKALTGAPVYMNSNDHDLYQQLDIQAGWLNMAPPERTDIDTDARDGDSLRLGEADLHLIHTPGHTQGSVCLLCPAENLLIAGDTLFRDSIGRTDLPGGDSRRILESIHTRLLTLPPETEVICGHGPGTTIGREKERNPFLQPGVRL